MKLYIFISNNKTNIWAGIGARRWAVSKAQDSIMKARETRAKSISVGNLGLIYCSAADSKALTTPFLFRSQPEAAATEISVWPEEWQMPFRIHPLGTPRKEWKAREAATLLPFNKGSDNTNASSVFKANGNSVFSPIMIGENDWAMILDRLADEIPS